jgi:glycine/serine hydroxymethyltransferase
VDDIDKRNRLDEAPFSYKITKNHTVLIDYYGKQVKLLKGKDAEKILEKIKIAENEKAVQLILAKITGNFKRGNERMMSFKNL